MPSNRVHIVVPRQFWAWQLGFGTLPMTAAEVAEFHFNVALDVYFDRTQQVVHVISGDLKRSGRIERMEGTTLDREGMVAYGSSEVVYAGIENDRGGSHAYMDIGWEAAQETFDQVLPRTWTEVVLAWR